MAVPMGIYHWAAIAAHGSEGVKVLLTLANEVC